MLFTAFLTGCSDEPAEGIKVKFTVDGYLHAQLSDGTLPNAPQKPSFEFDGWFFDEAFTIPFSYELLEEYASGATEITVYGKWRLDSHTHRLVHKASQPASCTEDGVIEHFLCSDCQLAYLDEEATTLLESTVIKSAHTFSFVDATAPTCLAKGNVAHYACAVCKKNYADAEGNCEIADVSLAVLAHTYASEWSFNGEEHWHDSTCTAHDKLPGFNETHSFVDGVCSTCGSHIFSYLTFTPTNYGSYSVKANERAIGMEAITIPTIVYGASVTEIEDGGFAGLSALQRLEIPNSITTVGANAFSDCYSLLSVTVGASVTEIKANAFSGCHSLVEIYNLSTSLSIEKNHPSLIAENALAIYTNANTQSRLTEQNGYVFYNDGENAYLVKYFGNDSKIRLDESLCAIKYSVCSYAFYKSNITEVVISGSVKAVYSRAFADSKLLSYASISYGVKELGEYIFFGCDSMLNKEKPIYCGYSENEKPEEFSQNAFLYNESGKLIEVQYPIHPDVVPF